MGLFDKIKKQLSKENIEKMQDGITQTQITVQKGSEVVDNVHDMSHKIKDALAPLQGHIQDHIQVQKANNQHRENMASILADHHEKMYQIDKQYTKQDKAMDKSFEVVDKGLENNDLAMVAEGLKSSTAIAMSNPFEKELEQLERDLDDPDAIIEL